VSGDEGNEVLQHDRTTGNEGRSTTEGDDGWRWELTEGAVSSDFTFGGVGVPPAAGRGQEARGAKWSSWHARKGERAGKRRGGGDRWHPFKGERRK
jgi:hypothetical protein